MTRKTSRAQRKRPSRVPGRGGTGAPTSPVSSRPLSRPPDVPPNLPLDLPMGWRSARRPPPHQTSTRSVEAPGVPGITPGDTPRPSLGTGGVGPVPSTAQRRGPPSAPLFLFRGRLPAAFPGPFPQALRDCFRCENRPAGRPQTVDAPCRRHRFLRRGARRPSVPIAGQEPAARGTTADAFRVFSQGFCLISEVPGGRRARSAMRRRRACGVKMWRRRGGELTAMDWRRRTDTTN